MFRRLFVFLLVSMGFLAGHHRAFTSEPSPRETKRSVFVLHSGMHTIWNERDQNDVAHSLREGLLKRGIAERDIIIRDNPFPRAHWLNWIPLESFAMYLEGADPFSNFSQNGYAGLHQVLLARGVNPKVDRVIWIGHSAGGQVGLTMAHLAHNLARFPDLARSTFPYRFVKVITLGSPIVCNLLPPEVKLDYYFSPHDHVQKWAANYGSALLSLLGHPHRLDYFPPLHPATTIRIFSRVEHMGWPLEARVLDRLAADTQPSWQSRLWNLRPEQALLGMFFHALEGQGKLVWEDSPQLPN